MFSDFKTQIEQILKNTDEEEASQTPDRIAAAAMYKIMIGVISKFVEKESGSHPEFDAALSLEWKSAGRMLRHIWTNAERMAEKHGRTASCCLTEDVVYAWVLDYYFLDDKEAVMKERAEQTEAEQKRREAEAEEAGYRKKALEILSRQNGWDDLPNEEKKKKIAAKMKSLKASDSRQKKKSAAKTQTGDSAPAKKETGFSSDIEKSNQTPDSSSNNSSEMCVTENAAQLAVEFANTLDGQMNLFDLTEGGE